MPAARLRKRRLQRDKDFTGARLASFRDVFLRHGLPGLALGLSLLAIPDLQSVFAAGLARASSHLALYAFCFVLILCGLIAYTWTLDRRLRPAQLGWVIYLGALSVWEEWLFRLAIPYLLESIGASVWLAALLSALVFGCAHYFTLRWQWQWCVSAFLGGLYFSYQIELHGDLILVAAIHWIATTINTPRLPGSSASVTAAG